MPLPTPTPDESEQDFMGRCMGDETMQDEYPDEDQRAAVCAAQWNEESEMHRQAATRIMPLELKAFADDERTFTGLASTWDLDLYGDVIEPGAFTKTLKAWRKNGTVIPLIDSHDAWSSIRGVVGKMLDGRETDDGLEGKWGVIDGVDGDEVLRRLRGGYVTGLSIGFEIMDSRPGDEEEQKRGVRRVLKEIDLLEVSVVAWPANLGARIQDVKMFVDHALRGATPECLDDDDRKTLRCLAGSFGPLLRPPAPSGAPAVEEKTSDPDDAATVTQPEAPPGKPATVPIGDPKEPTYGFEGALQIRIKRVLEDGKRLNDTGPSTEGE